MADSGAGTISAESNDGSVLPLASRSGGYYQAECEFCDFYEDGDEKAREKGRRHAAQNLGHRVHVDITRSLTYEAGLTHDGR